MQEDFYTSLLKLLIRLFGKISQRRRSQFLLLLILTLLSSFAEVISIGAVVPFIGVLIQPEAVYEQAFLKGFIDFLGIQSSQELVLPLCLLFAFAAIIAGLLRLLLLWVGIRLGNATAIDLGVEIFKRTLYQPYRVNISRNSSEIISAITLKVSSVSNVLISGVSVIISFTLFVSIITLLILMDPFMAITAALSFGGAYALIALRTQKKLSDNSQSIAREQTNVIKSLQEGLGAIRDILIDGTQSLYIDLYHQASAKLQNAIAENTFINQAPRFLMESIGIVLIALLALSFSYRPEGIAAALPVLGMLAMGAQRLLPVMQQLYGNWTVLKGNKTPLIEVMELLEQPLPETYDDNKKPLDFFRSIDIENISFKYDQGTPLVIENISFSVPKGARVGIAGTTGCGKSTLLDLLMGLLQPDVGKIKIDGQSLETKNLRDWQNIIAHVPQSIYLTDATVAENIAFGIKRELIDWDKVKSSAKQANIAEFIESKPSGYETRIGEKGVFLSGGQRQRLGIARALYKQANLLIFDEATSALDSETEESVMKSINGLSNDLTIIIVAHRLSTLKSCDFIIQLESGRISKLDTYENLYQQASVK